MTVEQLIHKLKDLPGNAEIFYGIEQYNEDDGLPIFELYDFEPVYYEKLRSCRSCLPSSNTEKNNVVVLEYE